MEFFWFIAGILSYMFVSKLLNYGHSIIMIQGAVYSSLQLLVLAKEDACFMRELKRKAMEESNLNQSEIDRFLEVDERTMESWKLTSFAKILAAVPRPYVGAVRFSSWDEAMENLKKDMGKKH